MEQFTYEEPKAVAAVLLVVNELTKVDKHKLTKILFFADQKHLSRYGRTVTSDSYCKMENGPVPSNIYGSVKGIVKNHPFNKYHGFEGKIEVTGNDITALEGPDIDQLSATDITCLLESIKENSGLNFKKLTDKSYGPAWQSVPLNQTIPFTEMAKEAGAPDYIMELVRMNLEAEELLSL